MHGAPPVGDTSQLMCPDRDYDVFLTGQGRSRGTGVAHSCAQIEFTTYFCPAMGALLEPGWLLVAAPGAQEHPPDPPDRWPGANT